MAFNIWVEVCRPLRGSPFVLSLTQRSRWAKLCRASSAAVSYVQDLSKTHESSRFSRAENPRGRRVNAHLFNALLTAVKGMDHLILSSRAFSNLILFASSATRDSLEDRRDPSLRFGINSKTEVKTKLKIKSRLNSKSKSRPNSRHLGENVFVLAVAEGQHFFAGTLAHHELESAEGGVYGDKGDRSVIILAGCDCAFPFAEIERGHAVFPDYLQPTQFFALIP